MHALRLALAGIQQNSQGTNTFGGAHSTAAGKPQLC